MLPRVGWLEGALRLIERHFGGMGRLLRWVQRSLTRFGAAVVLVLPMPSVCVLAGIAGARLDRTLLAMILGQCFWVSVTWAFGDLLSEVTRPFVAFVAEHVGVATAICVALVVAWQLRVRLRRPPRDEPPGPEPEG